MDRNNNICSLACQVPYCCPAGKINRSWNRSSRKSINGLQLVIEKLEKSITVLDSKIDQHDTRLARVEESTCSAHKRIDRLDHLIDDEKQFTD